MANEDKWDPTKPLPVKEDEEECMREAQARARVAHLVDEFKKPATPAPKKRRGIFSRDE